MKKSKNLPAPTEGREVSNEAYSAAVDCARLYDIRLIKSEFAALPEVYLKADPSWKYSYACQVGDAFYDSEASLLTGWIDGVVTIKGGRKKIFDLKTKWLVIYDVEGSPEEAAALKFVNKVASFAVYPYLRAQFSQLVSEAGVRLPPLPVMKEGRRRIPPAGVED